MKGLEAIRYSGAGLFFFGAVLLALLAGFTVYGYLSSAVPSQEIVSVSRDLVPGATITEADLTVRKVPDTVVPEGAVKSVKEAVGRRIRFGLAAGDYLREQHLVSKDGSDIPEKVKDMGAEYRAVMIPGELVPGMSRLIPGDRLELTGVLPVQEQRSSTTVAVPLGVATVLDVRLPEGQSDLAVVLAAVKAEEVSKVGLAMRVGTLVVAVQGTGQSSPPVPPLRLEALTGTEAAQPAAPAPQTTQNR